MITKEELLVALEDSSRNLYKSNEVFGLALKGLESESTVKRLIQDRNLWRKKHDDLADELDDKIIALEEKLKDKGASLDEASKIINDAREKHRVLEAQLKNTIPLQFHNAWEDDLLLTIISLRDERDAFQRLVGELHIEKNCIKTDLENVYKELGVLKSEIEMGEKAHRAQNADIDKLITENKKLARREREFSIVLGEWAAVEVYLAKSPKLTIGDKFSVACLRLLQERDKLEADLRFLLGH